MNNAGCYDEPLSLLRCGERTTTDFLLHGCFHIFLAQIFPAILHNVYYCKPDEKTWPTRHLSVIPGPTSNGALGAASELGFVVGPVIQANVRLNLEDD